MQKDYLFGNNYNFNEASKRKQHIAFGVLEESCRDCKIIKKIVAEYLSNVHFFLYLCVICI